MINITSSLLPETTGFLLPSELFESVMANTTAMMVNVSSLIPTLPSSKHNITEFSDFIASSSLASEVTNISVPGPHLDYEDNSTDNCTNEYCVSDDDYLSMIENHIFPTTYEWVLIAFHTVVFLVGLIGNALVCVAVYRNHSMRTVTNYFIVNLAVADFMVIFFCLPPTVVWDVTETWFMGTALCKIVLYFQTVSVTVSVLTLTFISVDRWYAICFPLKFKSTTGRAKTAIIIIWLLALAFDVPELMVLQTQPRKELRIETHFFTQCVPSWSDRSETTFHVLKTVLLYTLPLIFMSVAYCQIVRVLWRSDNIPGHTETMNYYGTSTCNNALSASRRNTLNTNANTTTEGQLRSRRKAAKMLVAVVIMFAVCYFPVHLLNILRYTMDIPSSDAMVTIALLSHWLCYANSAVNPVIYNFMSGKYRREFKRTFLQCRCLYNTKFSPSRTGHFNNRVTATSGHAMTARVTPGSKPAGCNLPSSTTSPVRHQARRHLSASNETSSNRL